MVVAPSCSDESANSLVALDWFNLRGSRDGRRSLSFRTGLGL